MTDTTVQAVSQAAFQTAATILPVLANTDPKLAAVAALAPLAVDLLQKATAAQQAGLLPPDQLAALFASIGRGIQSTHSQWQAMNAADAAKA